MSDIRDIADRLADLFKETVPLEARTSRGARRESPEAAAKRSASALSGFYEKARIEREKSKLGIIGRARVAFGLQQRLLSAGYPPVLVKQVLFAMLASAFVGKPR